MRNESFRLLASQPWAITVAGLQGIADSLTLPAAAHWRAPARDLDPLTPQAGYSLVPADGAQAAPSRTATAAPQNVAVISVRGTIQHHGGDSLWSMLFGGAYLDTLERQLMAAQGDASVKSILLDIDSPGGTSSGVEAMGNMIRSMRGDGRKPIVALANSNAHSAALWLATQADAFYAIPGAFVGSIGVLWMHLDYSKQLEAEGVTPTIIYAGSHKVDTHPLVPLSDEAAQRQQAIVNDIAASFVAAVAKGRGVTETKVRREFGDGDILTAKEAKDVGLIDGILTFEAAVKRSLSTKSRAPGAAAAPAEGDPPAGDTTDAETNKGGRERLAAIREAHAALAGGN